MFQLRNLFFSAMSHEPWALDPEDRNALQRVQEAFPGLVEVDRAPLDTAWKHSTAVLQECILVSVLLDTDIDKPKKKKVLEGQMKKAEQQGITDLIHKAIMAEVAKLVYDGT